MKKRKYEKPTIKTVEIEPINMLAGTQTDYGDAKKRRNSYKDKWLRDDDLEEELDENLDEDNFFGLW